MNCTKIRLLVSVLAVLGGIFSAGRASAEQYGFDVGVGMAYMYTDDVGYDKIDDDNWLESGTFRLRFFITDNIFAGYSYLNSTLKDERVGQPYYNTRLQLLGNQLDVGYRSDLYRYIKPYAGVGFVDYLTNYQLVAAQDTRNFDDRADTLVLFAGTDVMYVTDDDSVGLGGYFDICYALPYVFDYGAPGDLRFNGFSYGFGVRLSVLSPRKVFDPNYRRTSQGRQEATPVDRTKTSPTPPAATAGPAAEKRPTAPQQSEPPTVEHTTEPLEISPEGKIDPVPPKRQGSQFMLP